MLALTESNRREAAALPEEESNARLRHLAYNPRGESKPKKIFLFGFAVTHLKSLDSDESKQIQAFFLGFIWFCLDFLGRNSPASCICGPLGRSSRARLLICLPGRLGRQRPAVAPELVRVARRGAQAQRAHPLRAAAAIANASSCRKKLRKAGVGPMKSLTRANLCADAASERGPSPPSSSSWSCDPSATGRRSRLQSRR
jgi:hypothetical protein